MVLTLGWIVTGALGLYLTYIACKMAFGEGKVAGALALEFIVAPLALGAIHTGFGLVAWAFIATAEHFEAADPDSPDAITRRALASDPALRQLWEDEGL